MIVWIYTLKGTVTLNNLKVKRDHKGRVVVCPKALRAWDTTDIFDILRLWRDDFQ